MEATEQLQKREEKVWRAKGREDAVLTQRSRAARAVTAAEASLEMFNESLGAGEPEDPAEEQRLLEELRDARERAEPSAWTARVAGAQRAREQAEQERDDWARANFAEIAAEEAPKDPPVAERLQAAWAELQQAERAYAERTRVWTKLAPFGDFDVQMDCPRLPTAGDADTVRSNFARGIEPPTPRPLRQASEEQAA